MANNIIGQRIVLLRKKRGISQAQLADELKIQRSALNYYEKGTRIPKAQTLVMLSRFFDVTTDYILGCTSQSSIENNNIYEKLGIGDDVIDSISDIKNIGKSDMLARLLTHESFKRLLYKISQYSVVGLSVEGFDLEPGDAIEGTFENSIPWMSESDANYYTKIAKYKKPVSELQKEIILLFENKIKENVLQLFLEIIDDIKHELENIYEVEESDKYSLPEIYNPLARAYLLSINFIKAFEEENCDD